MLIYIVGRWGKNTWEVQGLYDLESDAKEACQKDWFIMPLEKNTPFPLSSEVIGYYPHIEEESKC